MDMNRISPSNNLSFAIGVDCQAENEWCRNPDPHLHGFNCGRWCPCWNNLTQGPNYPARDSSEGDVSKTIRNAHPVHPVVTDDPPVTTTDPVYRSVQTVEFAGGERHKFASAQPFPPGALMDFTLATIAHQVEPHWTVGGIPVDFLVPNNYGTDAPYLAPKSQTYEK